MTATLRPHCSIPAHAAFDDMRAALEGLVGAVEAAQVYAFPKAFSAMGIDPLAKAKTLLAKLKG